MNSANFFLRTKLLPPRPVPDVIERPRLLDKLRLANGTPITLVAADAGCGKTTLISEFVREQSLPVVWYQMDHTDADPAVFLGYLSLGLANIVPGFGSLLNRYLEEAGSDIAQFPERAADLFISEVIDSVDQPFIAVLDDYHHIGADTAVHKVVDRLLQYSSDLFRVIITTRDMPPLAIMKRRARSGSVIISREELLFTDDEVRELFRKTLNLDLREEELAAYRDRTHGWITALQLIRQVAEREIHSGTAERQVNLSEVLQQSEKDVFDYFAEEVIAREDPETELLMLHLSLLDSMPLDLCSTLFPDTRCSALLPALAQKNVFLTVAGDDKSVEEYRFHPLFRDFLRRRLRSKIGRAGVAAERVRIADHLFERGKWESAIPFLIDADENDRAAAILAARGSELISFGAFISLGMLAERIPKGSLEKHPRSLLHLAEIARLQGDIDRSDTVLRRAVELLNASSDATGEAEALHSLASLARRRGERERAMDLLERSEGLAEPGSETVLKCANTRGLTLIGAGDWAGAEQHFQLALELAEKQGNAQYIRLVAHNLALAPGFRGDFAEALRWFKRIFKDGETGTQLPQEAIGHLNIARLHLYRGEFDESSHHLQRSLELCQLYDLKALRGEIYECYGNYYREKNEFARAEEFYSRSAAAYRDAGIDRSTRELTEEIAKLKLLTGDYGRARMLLADLIPHRRAAGNELGIRTAELCLCQADLAQNKLEGLPGRIAEIRGFFRSEGHHYDEILAAMVLAETHSAMGNEQEMVEEVGHILDLSARFDYEYWLRGKVLRNPLIFGHEEVFERLPADLKECVVPGGAATAATAPSAGTVGPAAVPFADLTVNALGQIEIFRDREHPFASDAWTTKRARDIFCFIATIKNHRVPKDVLIDTFWPDDDPAIIEKNFHPTISHIRKALNSRQAFKQNFVVFREGSYQLDPSLRYSIDTEAFERSIADAEKAKREKNPEALRGHLAAAHAIYRGEFMEGVYDDWVEERRNYFRGQFLRVLSALAKLSFADKRWATVIRYTDEILAADPFREDIHRLKMKTLSAQGQPAAVKQHFDEMTALLRHELGIAPAAETQRLVGELIK